MYPYCFMDKQTNEEKMTEMLNAFSSFYEVFNKMSEDEMKEEYSKISKEVEEDYSKEKEDRMSRMYVMMEYMSGGFR